MTSTSIPALWSSLWRRPSGQWLGALLVTAAAFGLRLALLPVIGPRAPFALFYPAILVCGWFGGSVSGTICLVASTVLSLLLIPPIVGASAGAPADFWSLVLFVVVGTIVLFAGEGARRAREASER